MLSLLTIFLIFSLIPLIIEMLALLVGKKSMKERAKTSSFECGFDPFKKARTPFSIRFFLITIIFLIFDIEIAILLPVGIINKPTFTMSLSLVSLVITIILTMGLIHEWYQSALNWLL
uniref:NADH-ubiquinone oxidoreductase chain 3 n=1 Tax=Bahadzia jaraguensis TaxID=1041811 RepID=K7ZTR7_BAHJA|nr:NADH dehydrogenase subunit 3 [Bahadzia jaraguensis]